MAARRTRTAKALAQRIDLNYFKRSHPFRRWRLLLSIAVPALVLLWIGSYALAGSQAPFSSGPVAGAHASFGMRCEVCHDAREATLGFRAHVTDSGCLTCHDAPAHKTTETFTPDCASCHLEHRGRVQLASVGDGFCVQCHADLETKTGTPTVAREVGPFTSGHPEFAALRDGAIDRTALRFNHKVHLKEDLRGAEGPVTLECRQCHAPDGQRPEARGQRPGVEAQRWQAGGQGVEVTGVTAGAGTETSGMTYEAQCASCHPLFFDPLIDTPAPHEKPEIVAAFVRKALREHIAANPGQVGRVETGRGLIPENFPVERLRPARTADEWVERRTAAAERLLWNKTCRECHTAEQPVRRAAAQPAPPVIPPPNMPAAWMPHARFDHEAHQLVTCTSCHAADASTETSDVLMPSIATCQSCHKPGDQAAESRCFLCHQYHDWSKRQPVKPTFTLEELTR